MTPPKVDWYATQVRERFELQVEQALIDAGVTAYCPLERRPVRHARRREMRSLPLFPGYLFVGLSNPDQAGTAARVVGVVRVLGVGGRPVDPDVITALQAAQARGLFDRAAPKATTYAPGETVRIAVGPFRGFLAQVISAASDFKRLRILTRMLGGGPMEIDAAKVERPV